MSAFRTLLLPALLLPLPLFGAGCGEEAAQPEPTLRPVRFLEVESSGALVTTTLAGVTRASVESRLSFRVAGTVVAVPAAVGDEVEKGRVLARLDPADYELKVEEAEASRAQGEASLRRAQAEYDQGRPRDVEKRNQEKRGERRQGAA